MKWLTWSGRSVLQKSEGVGRWPHSLRLRVVPLVAVGGCECNRRVWGPRAKGLQASPVFPPASCGSSGCNRSMWLVSEELEPGCEGVAGVARTPSDFVQFLRLQSEDVNEIGGTVAIRR